MTIETLALYETEPLESPAFSPRSRLYPLAPIGVGTPAIESLTSYLTRLAHAHGVTVAKLAVVEFVPLVHKTAKAALNKFARGVGARNLNGAGDWAGLTITALGKLTLREEVRFLTLYPWRNVLSRRLLLRRHLAWCPACYHDWRQAHQTLYIPLLWALEVVQFCPRHHQALSHHCPYTDCHKRLPLIDSYVELGYCPFCKRWLGDETLYSTELTWSEGELQWQRWLTSQLAELLATAPHVPAEPPPHTLAQNIQAGLQSIRFNSVEELARGAGVEPCAFALWLRGSTLPQLDLLLRLCFHLGWQLLDVCLPKPDSTENLEQAPAALSKSSSSRKKVEVNQLSRQLESILADEQRVPCPAAQVAKQLGVGVRALANHCPEQYQQLVEQHRLYEQAQRQRRDEILERDLKAVLESDASPPPSVYEVARRLQINASSLRGIFPDQCHLISQKWSAFHKTRQAKAEAGLESVLAADEEPPPSMNEVAARLGESRPYLYQHFPDLCRAVTNRYHNPSRTQTNQRPPRSVQNQPHPAIKPDQVRDQLAAIVAAEEKPPPTVAEVARRLGHDSSTLRQAHPDLCRQLGQQNHAYRQAQKELLEARGREILAANETYTPSLAQVTRQLGVSVTWLKRQLPVLYVEITRRHLAEQQAARQKQQTFLEQLLAENPTPPPSLLQVAQSLGLQKGDSLQHQFPEASRLIMARYDAYQQQARLLAEAALKTALSSEVSSPPSLIQVARQLGYRNSVYLRTYFPDLCHQLVQRCRDDKRQVARAKLETFLSGAQSDPPLPLHAITQQLGYHAATLKKLCPELCQAILERYQSYWDEKKLAFKRALEAVLSGERTPPPSARAIAIECGYKHEALYLYFPDLTAGVVEKHKTYLKERRRQ